MVVCLCVCVCVCVSVSVCLCVCVSVCVDYYTAAQGSMKFKYRLLVMFSWIYSWISKITLRS